MEFQRLPLPLARPKMGTRSRFTLSPSTARSAGRMVREPTTATSTTEMTPRAREMKTGLFVMTSPARETITVTPA